MRADDLPAIPGGWSPEDFAARRRRVLSRLQNDALVLGSAPPQFRASDSEYAYRPDSDLFWLTGLVEPGAVAVLRGHDPEAAFVLFVRDRDPEAEQWTGGRLGVDGARELLGADAAYSLASLDERLPELLQGADQIHFRLGVHTGTEAHPGAEAGVRKALEFGRTRGTRRGLGPHGVLDPSRILGPLRRIKDAREIELIRKAAALTVEGFRAGLPLARAGRGEWEVQAALEAAFRREMGADPAFATIVGAGANGCVLHYVRNRSVIRPGDLVLVDAGAERELYAGDVTRTVPADGRFTPVQRDVYEVVARAQRAAVAAAAPGAPVSAVHEAAVREITSGLVALGVLTGDPEELVAREAHKPFFPHQTSHWLGLDVHDVGDYATGDRPVVLEPGMVLTVEPGLYFPDALAQGDPPPPPALLGMGIRLEDDVLITPDGNENLTAALPLDPDDVEGWLGS